MHDGQTHSTVLRDAAACAVPGSVGLHVASAGAGVDVEVPAAAHAGQAVRPVARLGQG